MKIKGIKVQQGKLDKIGAYRNFLDAGEKALYWGMTVEYGRRNMQMCMEWAQHCIEQLKG